MTVQELFQQRTAINADYFLLEVLRVMGEYEDEVSLSSRSNSTIIAMHRYSINVARIRITENMMVIERLPHVPYRSTVDAQQSSGPEGNTTSSKEGE